MLFRLRGSLTTFTIGRWRSPLYVLHMFAPIKWKACGTLQGNPLDFATKRLVQAFSEVSASGLFNLSIHNIWDWYLSATYGWEVGIHQCNWATSLKTEAAVVSRVSVNVSRNGNCQEGDSDSVHLRAFNEVASEATWNGWNWTSYHLPGKPNLYAQRRPPLLPGYPWVLGHAESACGLWAKIVSRKPSA